MNKIETLVEKLLLKANCQVNKHEAASALTKANYYVDKYKIKFSETYEAHILLTNPLPWQHALATVIAFEYGGYVYITNETLKLVCKRQRSSFIIQCITHYFKLFDKIALLDNTTNKDIVFGAIKSLKDSFSEKLPNEQGKHLLHMHLHQEARDAREYVIGKNDVSQSNVETKKNLFNLGKIIGRFLITIFNIPVYRLT